MNNKLKYNISFSEYSTFLQCPHKWYLSYCLRMPSDENEELIFGSCVHHTIQDILSKPYFKRITSWEPLFKLKLKKELSKIKNVQFLKKFSDQNLSYIFVKKGVELIKELNFFERFRDYEIVEVEYKLDDFQILSLEDINFFFKGYIDLILKNKRTGKYLLIDWKTSNKEWDIKKKMKDNEDLYAQLGLYKLFFAKKENIALSEIEVQFYNLPRKDPKKQMNYSCILDFNYLKHLFRNLQDVCEQISEINPNELNKIKFRTKKNYCYRCIFNTERLCNNEDEHQPVA